MSDFHIGLTLPRRSILCVQPDRESSETLRALLKDHDCVRAGNAYEALRALHARPFDAHVLEYWLPDLAGPSLCREIRKADPHSPVLFCTAASGCNDEKRAFRAGADAYLRKPVDRQDVESTLRNLLTRCDSRSLRAKSEAERAVLDAFERRGAGAADLADEKLMQSLERIARAQAYKAFIGAGGTRANFERWWPHLFGSARANHSVSLV